MNPGELNHRITIQQSTTGKVDGFDKEQWNTFKTLWSKKQGLISRNKIFYEAGAAQSEEDIVFKIRYTTGIKSNMRVVDNEDTYKIKAVVDKDGTRRELYIVTSVVTTK